MNFVIFIISGVIMGLIAAVPIGPVNLICIRRTFAFGKNCDTVDSTFSVPNPA